jgi:hypothetical protein
MRQRHVTPRMKRTCKGSLVLGIGLVAGVGYGQVAGEVIILSATGPRPLVKAADQLEARYGIPVSYEDATYAYEGDLVDETDPAYKLSHPGIRALGVKNGSAVLRGNLSASVRSPADAMPLFQSLLDDYVRAGNPGEYALVQSGDGVVIVPTRVRNENGVLLPDQSPLETRISFPELQRTDLETLAAICGAILANSGKKVVVGTTPFGGLQSPGTRGSYYVTIGASNEPARSVLQRTLAGLQWADSRTQGPILKMGWWLLYDPGERVYALSVHQVFREAPSPTGRTVRQPVVR